MAINDNDLFLVNTSDQTKTVKKSELMTKPSDNDYMLVNKASDNKTYKVKFSEVKDEFGPNLTTPVLTSVTLTDEGNSATDRFTDETFKASVVVDQDNKSTKQLTFTVNGELAGTGAITATGSISNKAPSPTGVTRYVTSSEAGWNSGPSLENHAWQNPSNGEIIVWHRTDANSTMWFVPPDGDPNNIVKVLSTKPSNAPDDIGDKGTPKNFVYDTERNVIVASMWSGEDGWESSDNGRTWTYFADAYDWCPLSMCYGLKQIWYFSNRNSGDDIGKFVRQTDSTRANYVFDKIANPGWEDNSMQFKEGGAVGSDSAVCVSLQGGVFYWSYSSFSLSPQVQTTTFRRLAPATGVYNKWTNSIDYMVGINLTDSSAYNATQNCAVYSSTDDGRTFTAPSRQMGNSIPGTGKAFATPYGTLLGSTSEWGFFVPAMGPDAGLGLPQGQPYPLVDGKSYNTMQYDDYWFASAGTNPFSYSESINSIIHINRLNSNTAGYRVISFSEPTSQTITVADGSMYKPGQRYAYDQKILSDPIADGTTPLEVVVSGDKNIECFQPEARYYTDQIVDDVDGNANFVGQGNIAIGASNGARPMYAVNPNNGTIVVGCRQYSLSTSAKPFKYKTVTDSRFEYADSVRMDNYSNSGYVFVSLLYWSDYMQKFVMHLQQDRRSTNPYGDMWVSEDGIGWRQEAATLPIEDLYNYYLYPRDKKWYYSDETAEYLGVVLKYEKNNAASTTYFNAVRVNTKTGKVQKSQLPYRDTGRGVGEPISILWVPAPYNYYIGFTKAWQDSSPQWYSTSPDFVNWTPWVECSKGSGSSNFGYTDNEDHGYFCLEKISSRLYRTSGSRIVSDDGGVTWTTVGATFPNIRGQNRSMMPIIQWLPHLNGYGCLISNSALFTDDGENWTRKNFTTSGTQPNAEGGGIYNRYTDEWLSCYRNDESSGTVYWNTCDAPMAKKASGSGRFSSLRSGNRLQFDGLKGNWVTGVPLTNPYVTAGFINRIQGNTIELAGSSGIPVNTAIPVQVVPQGFYSSYLNINGSNVVTGLTKTPTYVYTNAEGSFDYELKFPATFDTGFTPDEELLSGTTLKVEVRAFNGGGLSNMVSDSVTPTSTTRTDTDQAELIAKQLLLDATYSNRKEVHEGQQAANKREDLADDLKLQGYTDADLKEVGLE